MKRNEILEKIRQEAKQDPNWEKTLLGESNTISG